MIDRLENSCLKFARLYRNGKNLEKSLSKLLPAIDVKRIIIKWFSIKTLLNIGMQKKTFLNK